MSTHPEQRNKAVFSISLAVVLLGVFGAVSFGQSTRPAVLRDVRIDQKLNDQVPLDLRFRDETGAPVKLRDYFHEKPVILTLVYYKCPMLCTLVLNGLVRAMKPLGFEPGKDFEIVTVSFDPRENADLAKTKKQSYIQETRHPEYASGWHFLTGDQEPIKRLADSVGFRYVYDPKTDQYAHASAIMVLTPDGKVSKYFYGIDYSTKDLRLGLVEASESKIGSKADELLLFCFHYDPTSGKYGLAISRVLQAGGVITLVALGSFVLFSLRREKRRRLAALSPSTELVP